jgi:hypothetical protein
LSIVGGGIKKAGTSDTYRGKETIIKIILQRLQERAYVVVDCP